MDKTYVVVASKVGARIFSYRGPKDGLVSLKTIDHPEGKSKGHAFLTDAPGQTYDRKGQGHHNMNTEESAREHDAKTFAKTLVGVIEADRKSGIFGRLVLVAEPGFLGMIGAELSSPTASLIHAKVSKDLAKVPDRELAGYLVDVLPGVS